MYKQYFREMISGSKNIHRLYLLLTSSCLFVFSCKQIDIFEKNTTIPDYKWNRNFAAKGTFIITDTTSSYNIYLVLRHTDAYKYNNIWLNIGLQAPGDTMYFQKADLALGTDANGWEGSGMNDIWEVRKSLRAHTRFIKAGEYKFSISQVMRDDPLPNVISAGMRVMKSQ